MNTARAGWAEIEITPPPGLPMGGRGPQFTPGASILDPLIAQALVLEDHGGRRTLWVSMDMIGLSYSMSSMFRYELAAMTGIPYEAIILNFSHTHSGPMTGFEGYATETPKPEALQVYEAGLIPGTVRMACEAVENLQPVTVRLHQGQSDIGINRRRRNHAGEMEMNPNPDGVYNPDLWVLDIAAKAGGDRCVVFCYGCHPVIVYGFAYDGISADYPGVCRGRLEEALGQGTHTQFIQGLAGNVRPRLLADPEAGRFRKSTPEDPVAVGEDLAGDVIDALNREGETLELDLSAAAGFALARRDRDRILPLEHWQSLAESGDEMSRNLGGYWTNRFRSGLSPVQVVPWGIGLVRLTREHRIAWLSGEVLAEWLGCLRDWLEDERLIAWGYCQDGRGYMPTDEIIPEGGYEVIRSNTFNKTGPGPFVAGINETARQGFLGLARQLEEG